MLKKITAVKKIGKSSLLWILVVALVAIIVGISTRSPLWFVGILLLGFCVKRLFFGVLRLKDGDIIYFYGLPGSGKSLTMARVADDNKDRFCVVNNEFSHFKNANCVLPSNDLGKYSFPAHSMHLIDECSNDGFDNRTWSTNFESTDKLRYVKKIRHHKSCIMFTNQGREEIDKKLIQGLIFRFYMCENRSWYSKAVCLIPDTISNGVSGDTEEVYRTPTLFERLFDPSMVIYTPHFRGKNLYSTVNKDKLPAFRGYIK